MKHRLAKIQMAGWDAATGIPLYYVVCECGWMSTALKSYSQFLDVKTTTHTMNAHRKEMQ